MILKTYFQCHFWGLDNGKETAMKKSLLLVAVFFVMNLVGCGSTGKTLSIENFTDIKPLGYEIQFNAINNFKTESQIGKNTLPFRKSDYFKWEEVISAKITDQDFNNIWNEIKAQDKQFLSNTNSPKYIVNIELCAVMTGLNKRNPVNLEWHGFSLFKVNILDKQSQNIHDKLFKIYGFWTGNGMGSVKGPADMGYSYPNKAIVRLGLYDILSYICREDFLNNSSGGIELFEHIEPGMKPTVAVEDLPFLYHKPAEFIFKKNYYNEGYGALIYSKFIMGEDLEQKDLQTAFGINQYEVLGALKLGHDRKWPYFPPKISVKELKYTFERP